MDDNYEDNANMEEENEGNVEDKEEDNEEEEHVTAESVLQSIENAWLNEKFAPEILPHKSDLVECMLQQIKHMEENMKRLSKDDMRIAVHSLELERIRFVISSYLRIRLEKIEKYTVHILSEESNRTPSESYLTPGELRFAKEYLTNLETLFRSVALQHMPTNFQSFDVNQYSVKPNMRTHVFLRANKTVTGIVLPGEIDEEINFDVGSQHVIPYVTIADLVKKGVVQLI